MATQADVRKIALSLPEVVEEAGRFAFSVKGKGMCWVWLERIHPKKARVPQPKVLAVRTSDLAEKDVLLASDEEKFFTEPHYNGYPAVMVRLEAVTKKDLEALIGNAYRGIMDAAPRARAAARPRRRPGAAGSAGSAGGARARGSRRSGRRAARSR